MNPLELSQAVLLGPVFDALPVGVVVLDQDGFVRVFNKHEEKLANRQREQVVGRPFFVDIAPCMNVRELAGAFFAGVKGGELATRVEFSFPFPHMSQARDVVVRMQSVIVNGAPHGLLLVEDVSMERAVTRMKETLATLLVHDFKNPLSVINSNLEFVRSLLVRHDAVEAVDDSLLATKQLHAMVLDLLDIARLETGTFPLVRAMTDASMLVQDLVRGNGALAREADVTLVADHAAPVEGWIDPTAVRRSLANLIENAIRHAPRRSRVVVSVAFDDGVMALRVADEGAGVPAEMRETIFEKFGQGSDHARTTSNRGLGLTFVRMVARAHGGDATVGDTHPRGATFEMRLRADIP
jgi:photoactive yellow protein